MWKSRNKTELIIEVWEKLDCEDVGAAEIEAIEIYPAESRLVDTSNQYWLWCLPPGEHVPVGFFDGRVVSNNEYAQQFGAVQRDYDDESAS